MHLSWQEAHGISSTSASSPNLSVLVFIQRSRVARVALLLLCASRSLWLHSFSFHEAAHELFWGVLLSPSGDHLLDGLAPYAPWNQPFISRLSHSARASLSSASLGDEHVLRESCSR
jgi:hypothetical protein